MLELRMDTDLRTELPAAIDFNFEELKAELAERLDHYNSLVVTEDGIKEAKADRAKLNKLRTAIDTRRKDIKKEYLKPYNDFEGKIKELTVLIDQPIKAIDTQLQGYEERRKEERKEKVAATYKLAIREQLRDIIPLEKIFDPKWLNATTSMKKVLDDLRAIDERVSADLLVLETVDEKYQILVKNVYMNTLSIQTAMKHKEELIAAEEAFIAREAERKAQEEARKAREAEIKAREAEQAALQAQKATEAKPEPQTGGVRPEMTEPEVKMYTLRLEFTVTMEQAQALRNFIDQNSIQYRKI